MDVLKLHRQIRCLDLVTLERLGVEEVLVALLGREVQLDPSKDETPMAPVEEHHALQWSTSVMARENVSYRARHRYQMAHCLLAFACDLTPDSGLGSCLAQESSEYAVVALEMTADRPRLASFPS